jgi:CBS domain-containing protein
MELMVLTVVILSVIALAVGIVGFSARDTFRRLNFGPLTAFDASERSDRVDVESRHDPLEEMLRDERRQKRFQWTGIAISVVLNVLLWIALLRRGRLEARRVQNQSQDEGLHESADTIFEKRQRLLRTLIANGVVLVEGGLEVRHVMTAQPPTVLPDTPLREAAELMKKEQIRHLLVCTPNGELRGVVTSAQLLDESAKTCGQVMNADPPVVAPDTLVMQALTHLAQDGRSCLPVVREGIVQGIVTVTDALLLSQAMLQFLARISDQVKPAISGHRSATITEMAMLQTSPLECDDASSLSIP